MVENLNKFFKKDFEKSTSYFRKFLMELYELNDKDVEKLEILENKLFEKNRCPECLRDTLETTDIYRYENNYVYLRRCKFCHEYIQDNEFFNKINHLILKNYEFCPKCHILIFEKKLLIETKLEVQTKLETESFVFINIFKCPICNETYKELDYELIKDLKEAGVPFDLETLNWKRQGE